jgi:hypothetical protein
VSTTILLLISTPPSINIQRTNQTAINVGDTYTDLGAIVHDNQGHDLSYRAFINGVLSGNILIDTSQPTLRETRAPERWLSDPAP